MKIMLALKSLRVLVIGLILGLSVTCGGGGGGGGSPELPPPSPIAISLTAGSSSITAGTSTTLTPVFANGTGVISPGNLTATSGKEITVSPAATTTYTLTVTSSTGASAQATTTIVVIPAPMITSFRANSTSITAGNSTKLMPIFSNGAGKIGTTLYGDQVSTSVISGTSVDISPTTTTSYYLTVTNSVGTKSSTSTSVTVYPAPVATSLTVGSQVIEWGSSTTITPVFSEGNGVINATPGSSFGKVVSGVQYPISPKTNTRYSLTVSNAIGSSASKEASIQVLNAFSEGGPDVDRIAHTATLLQNGKVLIVGGLSRNNNTTQELSNILLGSAILYDPSSGGYSSTGSLTTPRAYHTATLLPNGKVLVIGGVSKIDPYKASTLFGTNELETTKSIELYDPSTGIWNNFGLLMDTRSWHTATLLQNGKVLIVGGGNTKNSPLLFSELYDPTTQLSTRTGPSTPFRGFSGASYSSLESTLNTTLLSNGKVLIGGYLLNPTSSLDSLFWLYDPSNETYATTGSIVSVQNNVKHSVSSITRLPDGKVFAFGSTTSLYNPSTGTWANTQPPAIPAGDASAYREYRQSSAVLLSNGKVLLFTTAARSSSSSTFQDRFFSGIFDPTTATWSNAGLLGSYRFGYAVTPLSNGKILVTGGACEKISNTNFSTYEYKILSEYFNR
jgi:hypothetical protein